MVALAMKKLRRDIRLLLASYVARFLCWLIVWEVNDQTFAAFHAFILCMEKEP